MRRFFLFLLMLVVSIGLSATTYYVDSALGSDTNSGTSTSSAWSSISKVNSTSLVAGDSVLFKRGCTFSGMLQPNGSGTSTSPIVIADYEVGELPLIVGDGNDAGIRITDKQGIELNNLEVDGGSLFGIDIKLTTTGQTYTYFRVTNCVVRDVYNYSAITSKQSGLIVFHAGTENSTVDSTFDNVVIDGCTAYGTDQWAGIEVWGGRYNLATFRPLTWSNAITIQNCTAYNTYGDGIVVWVADNVSITNNVCYSSGLQTSVTVGTPAGIWTWATRTASVTGNESYDHSTPDYDGAGFDIDYHNTNNTYAYNYAHGCKGPGIMILGAKTDTTLNPVVKYNIFSANNQKDENYHASMQGEVYFCTWDSGKIGNAKVYNNTMYHKPINSLRYAIYEFASSQLFGCVAKNNIIYGDSVKGKFMVYAKKYVTYDYNCYYWAGGTPNWYFYNKLKTTFALWKAADVVRCDPHGMNVNPLLTDPTYSGVGMPVTEFKINVFSACKDTGVNMGLSDSRDFYNETAPYGTAYDIGADEYNP